MTSFVPAHRRRLRLLLAGLLVAAVAAGAWWAVANLNRLTWEGLYQPVDMKALGGFTFSEVRGTDADVPEQFRALDGKKVRLEGQMYCPNDARPFVNRFELLDAGFTFGAWTQPPRVQERVFASAPAGELLPDFSYQGVVVVHGTLHVRTHRESGLVASLYELTVDRLVLKNPPPQGPSALPWWMAVAALPPALGAIVWQLRWYRRRTRVLRGLCPQCGYDLHATPERGPECGHVVAGKGG